MPEVQPNELLTVMLPEVVPTGTVAIISLGGFRVNMEAMELNFTEVRFPKFEPEITTLEPMAACIGVMEVSMGAGFVVITVLADFEQPFTVTVTE